MKLRILAALCLTLAVASWADGQGVLAAGGDAEVREGERVGIHFVCRLQNGEVAAATREDVSKDASIAKAAIFAPRKVWEPVSVTAGRAAADNAKVRGFETQIIFRLAQRIVGMHPDEVRSFELKEAKQTEQAEVIDVSRVRNRPKETRISHDKFQQITGKKPEGGAPFIVDKDFPGTVVAVDEKEVLIRFSRPQKDEVMTPFGKANVREKEKSYEVTIEAKPGTLVRSGPLVGRIVGMNEQMISVDYGWPFTEEPLVCEVKVIQREK